MVNFVEAYKSGLNSAELAETNRNEINSVFSELNQQLKDVSDGRIFISRKSILDKGISSILNMNMMNNYYLAITAENPFVTNSEKELARWDQDRSGFPCKIILGSETMYCRDKKGLENGLAVLLRDPIVGETLRKLQNLPLPEQVSSEAADIDVDASDC
ncbi:MAG: hypothetical protein NTX45_23740 [Proteobacteria bacterium]|nr:hypothetical protein [Pseudomonadota bacterium]